jgi:hypothetical protein
VVGSLGMTVLGMKSLGLLLAARAH